MTIAAGADQLSRHCECAQDQSDLARCTPFCDRGRAGAMLGVTMRRFPVLAALVALEQTMAIIAVLLLLALASCTPVAVWLLSLVVYSQFTPKRA